MPGFAVRRLPPARRAAGATALILSALLLAPPALAGGSAAFYASDRTLEDDDIEDVELDALEDSIALGASVSLGLEGRPLDLVAGIQLSHRDKTESFGGSSFSAEATYRELSFGVRRSWATGGRARPFAGGGLSWIEGELDLSSGAFSFDEKDSGPGAYAEVGIIWQFGERFDLGGVLRLLQGSDLDLDGMELPSGYYQAGVSAGWRWSGR